MFDWIYFQLLRKIARLCYSNSKQEKGYCKIRWADSGDTVATPDDFQLDTQAGAVAAD